MKINRYFTEVQKSTNTTSRSTITSRPTSLEQESQESIDKLSNIDLTANVHHALQNRDHVLAIKRVSIN